MQWKETKPGTFSRPLGLLEEVLRLLGDGGHALGRENWAMDATAIITPRGTLRKADMENILHRGWVHLRF